ncbi:MAG: hypothetical protein OXE95_01615 [Chloroflexi bacterium]|nr:hypothetical protein [Chloroflexota bacterium]MCY4246258.1 hypothetical protein [Chloroflexota bacterium]
MNIAAERMRRLGARQQEFGAPSSIFGSAAGLAQSIQSDERLRISLYPIICADMPEVAMGLAACLAYLLEQYPDTRVYRCFARIDSNSDSSEITADDYQFAPADWELAGLADNVQMWGRLNVAERVELALRADLSLLSGEAGADYHYEFASLADAISGLPSVAANLVAALDSSAAAPALISYAPVAQDAGLRELLPLVFDWNLDVYLLHWGVDWSEADIIAQFVEIAARNEHHKSEFSDWCLGMMAKQVMQAGLEDIGDALIPQLREPEILNKPAAIAAIALGLAELGYQDMAVHALENHLSAAADASLWHSLATIQADAGKFAAAVDVAQSALEAGMQHPALHLQYAQLLMTAEAQSWQVDDVLLIDPEDIAEAAQIPQEIANALKLHHAHNPRNLGALQLALSYMIDAEDEELWIYFERLVESDRDGDFLGEACDRLLDLDDFSPAQAILQRHANANASASACLAQLALEAGDTERAAGWIAQCRAHIYADDPLELDLQRLELQMSRPGFDESLAEIRLTLSAGKAVAERDVDLLESACKIAPLLVDVRLALSRCYLSWQDRETAVEVLDEAEAAVGGDPQLALALAQLHWTGGQREAAIDKLNAGLAAFPNDVPLLAQMAMALIVSGQMDDARGYIALAEAISPSHAAIDQVRRLVAQTLAQQS